MEMLTWPLLNANYLQRHWGEGQGGMKNRVIFMFSLVQSKLSQEPLVGTHGIQSDH